MARGRDYEMSGFQKRERSFPLPNNGQALPSPDSAIKAAALTLIPRLFSPVTANVINI